MTVIKPKSESIENKRLREGLSMREASHKVGINHYTWYKVENGQNVRPQTAKAVCNALGAEFDDLFEIIPSESSGSGQRK